MDITDVEPGEYYIKQCANFEMLFAEATFENNCIKTPVLIPPKPTKTPTVHPTTSKPTTHAPTKKPTTLGPTKKPTSKSPTKHPLSG
jgi:hypothetical protein